MDLLPYEAYYENSAGSVLRLDRAPYVMTDSTLFNSSWSVSTAKRPMDEGERMLRAYRKCSDRRMTVEVTADSAALLSEKLSAMSELLFHDLETKKAGRLWINGRYMSCWCTSSTKKLSCDFISRATVELTVYPERPVWCAEKLYRFTCEVTEPTDGHCYMYSYPKRYGAGRRFLVINNEHYSASPMKIIFYGPADYPNIYLGSANIGINITLGFGEYAVIDQLTRDIYRVTPEGTKVNCFNERIKNGNTFTFAPPGSSTVQLGSSCGVDIVLTEQRSEPTWTLD